MRRVTSDRSKIVATMVVAIFFLFFWINGPLLNSLDLNFVQDENLEIVKPVLISDDPIQLNSYVNTVDEVVTSGDGFNMVLDEAEEVTQSSGLLMDEHQVQSSEYGDELLANARKFYGNNVSYELKQTEDFYYVSIEGGSENLFYFQSKGLSDDIKGYSGPINVGLYISESGFLVKMVHVASKETMSYLRKIAKTHYYTQYENLDLTEEHTLDGISGATISSKAMASITSDLVSKIHPEPLADYIDRMGVSDFETRAELNWIWIPQIVLILFLFLYAFQKKWRKSKRFVLLTTIVCMLYIGFYLNDSFTYITFLHPFIGTSLSSFMGLYALFVLLGAIWGKNTYCKYICPYGNVQRLQLKIWKGATRKFPISNKWIKRIRFFVLIVLISGILAGFRNLSHLEPFPYIFGFEIQSIWYFGFAVFALLINWIYPLIWCRLLCPTGSVLDTISAIVEKQPKKSKNEHVRRVYTVKHE
jgi:NosR/NirI family transcriptional regulator, nitrous oxide reductase regulator